MEKGHTIKVLDHGYVRFVDSLGSDESIVEAARTSTGRGFVSWEPYKRCKTCEIATGVRDNPLICDGHAGFELFPRGDLGILDYLYRNRHTTPFEMCELIIDVRVPMDCWRQWIRHRTANVNEYSTRYSEAIDLMAQTPPGEWRTQGQTNRQGSGAVLSTDAGVYLSMREAEFQEAARALYDERLANGVAKEQARKDLPLSTYTAARWKCDLHNVFHFLGLRMHAHAQLEIRLFANAVAEIVKSIWPRSYALFEEYSLHGAHFSRSELATIRKLIDVDAVANTVEVADREAIRKKLGV